jgi:ankyrin repeat protein
MTTRDELSEIEEKEGDHTELMRAALDRDIDSVKALSASGAEVDAKDNKRRTVLMFAVINMHADTAKQLLEHGANAHAAANDGGTALMLASQQPTRKVSAPC